MRGLKLTLSVLLLLAGAVGLGMWLARTAALPGADAGLVVALGSRVAAWASWMAAAAVETVRVGHERAPAVVAGLGVLVLVPLLAVAVGCARRLGMAFAAEQELRSDGALDTAALPRLANVWIDVDGPRRQRLRIAGELVRIGRDEENDLRLEDPNVHRHHALIQRTADAEFVVVDVSGERGNGVVVNGRRLARARLRDGDLIELGTSRVRFRCELISHALPA